MINKDRVVHIINVAKLMRLKALEMGWGEKKAIEMFYLGMNHDLGYEFGDNLTHGEVAGNILRTLKYKNYKEIMFHGKNQDTYKSKELDLLNWSDMHIDKKGTLVTFEERLEDIKNRYGNDSIQFKECYGICEKLDRGNNISKDFDKNIKLTNKNDIEYFNKILLKTRSTSKGCFRKFFIYFNSGIKNFPIQNNKSR